MIRNDPEDGTNEIIVHATATTNATVSYAGEGFKFTLTTKLESDGGKTATKNGASASQVSVAPTTPLDTNSLKVEQTTVFRLKTAATKYVRLSVEAKAVVESIIPTGKAKELTGPSNCRCA